MSLNFKFYYITSIVKFILGISIVWMTYNFINVYEDPVIAISLMFVGSFIAIWGLSFFLFWGGQLLFRNADKERIIKDSYKLSLLFGIFSIINILLIVLGSWNKIRGIILLGGFILIHILLLENNQKIENEE